MNLNSWIDTPDPATIHDTNDIRGHYYIDLVDIK